MTTKRTIDSYTFFERAAAAHKPVEGFTGKTKSQFQAWKRRVLPKVLGTLGKLPRKVPVNAELMVQWTQDALVKQRWVIDVQPGLSAIVLLFRPESMAKGEKRPAILCCHGHGPFGKDPIMGIDASPEMAQNVRQHNYNYGLQMAKAGFVTYSLDWLGFGERDSRRKPHDHAGGAGRDPCNVNYLCATLLGTTLLAMNCHDGSRATDFVCAQPFVDPKRLGVMGLSQGGTMTTWMALTDGRFVAADIICYVGPFYDIAFRTYNVCGSQVTPGLFELVDTFDLQGLIAPRPVLMEIGIHDTCFHIDHSLSGHYRKLEKIYAAAGATDKLELDLFPTEHAWGGNKSVEFFRKHLKADW